MGKYEFSDEFKYLSKLKIDISSHKTIKRFRLLENISVLMRPNQNQNVRVRQIKIPGYLEAEIRLFEYRPKGLKEAAPCILFFHGGGFVLGNAKNCAHLSFYATKLNCIIYSVQYRLSPEFPFPYALYDGLSALRYLTEHSSELAIDQTNIAVMGESAGGCIAASLAQLARDNNVPIKFQMLLMPVISNDCDFSSMNQFSEAPVWTRANSVDMWRHYLGESIITPPKYAVPIFGNLKELPACYLETAQFDPLKDEGEHYAEALKKAGCTVQLVQTEGTLHGYDQTPFPGSIVNQYLNMRIEALRRAFLK